MEKLSLHGVACLLLALFLQSPATAVDQVPFSEKLELLSILDAARRGESQEVMVDFDSGGVEEDIRSQRLALSKVHDRNGELARQRRVPIESLDGEVQRQENNLVQTLKSSMEAVKQAAFANGRSGNCTIVDDIADLSQAAVRIPDYDSLLKLLANPVVRAVRTEKHYVPNGSWRE